MRSISGFRLESGMRASRICKTQSTLRISFSIRRRVLVMCPKPNGTPRKLLDVSKATNLGWTYKTELEDGLRLSYEDFLNNPMRAER